MTKALKCDGYVATSTLKKANNTCAVDDREKAECLADSIEQQFSLNFPPFFPNYSNKYRGGGSAERAGVPQGSTLYPCCTCAPMIYHVRREAFKSHSLLLIPPYIRGISFRSITPRLQRAIHEMTQWFQTQRIEWSSPVRSRLLASPTEGPVYNEALVTPMPRSLWEAPIEYDYRVGTVSPSMYRGSADPTIVGNGHSGRRAACAPPPRFARFRRRSESEHFRRSHHRIALERKPHILNKFY
ncbi:hypothetical protein EVAR_47863_1 [Eumeta japonica]|uniref:Uncharacterized protein n=1 Tax=Eumeta variegata TaxID=151549 RepID=A0A4C1ZT80_EUMVA|nr:hypothetical protein EVAR_47863_1 [Eumeta japonica]